MRWKCRRCSSTRVGVIVEVCDTVAPVDQESDTLRPSELDPEPGNILGEVCDNCGSEGKPGNLLRRVAA